MYFNKKDCSYISEKINASLGSDLKIKLIGKFKTSENNIQIIRKKNVFLCWEDLKKNIFCIFTKKKILNKVNILDLSFKTESFYICTIDGINKSEIENAKKAKILLPINNDKRLYKIFKKKIRAKILLFEEKGKEQKTELKAETKKKK